MNVSLKKILRVFVAFSQSNAVSEGVTIIFYELDLICFRFSNLTK